MNFEYFKFWLSASNEHGVHSPFVFNLLIKGIYTSHSKWSDISKKKQFLDRMITYFKPKEITVLGFDTAKESGIAQEVVNFDMNNGKTSDFIIFGNNTDNLPSQEKLIQVMHNDSVFILDRRNKQIFVEDYWQKIVALPEITVTLDFYYFGVAFKRKEQLKQNFNLRLHQDKILRLIKV